MVLGAIELNQSTQKAIYNGISSSFIPATSGVPQGTVL